MANLVNAIAASEGSSSYLEAIGTTAAELAEAAAARFEAAHQLRDLCQLLHANNEGQGEYKCHGKGYIADDARVIGFFLAENATLVSLRCVSGSSLGLLPADLPHFSRAACTRTTFATRERRLWERRSRATAP